MVSTHLARAATDESWWETLPPLERGTCQVWWASTADAHAGLARHLDQSDLARAARLRRAGDRARHLLGAVIMRALAAAALGGPPGAVPIRRECHVCGGAHGKPIVDGLAFSVSHAADRAVVAVSPAGPIGVDVELVVRRKTVDLLKSRTLTANELAALERIAPELQARAFTRYWTRKESLLKATGQGLTVPFRTVEVTGPYEAAAVVHWRARPAGAEETWLQSLDGGPDYEAAVAAIGTTSLIVEQFDASPLLSAARGP